MTIGLVALMTRVSVTLHHAASSINYVMFFAALFKKKIVFPIIMYTYVRFTYTLQTCIQGGSTVYKTE